MRPSRSIIVIATLVVALLSTAVAAYAMGASSSNVRGCRTVGAVGISSATVTIPATKVASRFVVTVTTDNVANQPYPQDVPGFGGSFAGQLSNAMNPASYNNNALGGTIDVWDSLNHVATALPALFAATQRGIR